jgi:hypothetical protein
MALRLTDHHFAWPGSYLPPVDVSLKLDRVVAANGLFMRGLRPGLEVCMALDSKPVPGLKPLWSYVQWGYPLLPARFLDRMLGICRARCAETPTEALFHLSFSSKLESYGAGARTLDYHMGWHLEFPDQMADAENVKPVRQGASSSESRAIIEIHSHHHGRAEFSEKDDRDEGGNSFRVYGVLGAIFTRPSIRMRVGLFGNFHECPAGEFFEMPAGVSDLAKER